MGGKTSRPTTTYSAPVIYRNKVETFENKEKGITVYNFKYRLAKYNLSSRQMNQIEIGLECAKKITKLNKFVFNIQGDGKFIMSCYTFKIRKNGDGERDVEIKTNRLVYNVKATQEYESKGWGILFWYRRKYTQSRSLTDSEIKDIKKEMKQKLERNLLC